jgi:hypothetical protein
MKSILDVKCDSGYKLILKFDNGEERLVQMAQFFKGPLFQALKDIDLFRQVRVDKESGTIVWPNGADLDPDVLYNHSRLIRRLKKKDTRNSNQEQMIANSLLLDFSKRPNQSE